MEVKFGISLVLMILVNHQVLSATLSLPVPAATRPASPVATVTTDQKGAELSKSNLVGDGTVSGKPQPTEELAKSLISAYFIAHPPKIQNDPYSVTSDEATPPYVRGEMWTSTVPTPIEILDIRTNNSILYPYDVIVTYAWTFRSGGVTTAMSVDHTFELNFENGRVQPYRWSEYCTTVNLSLKHRADLLGTLLSQADDYIKKIAIMKLKNQVEMSEFRLGTN